MLIYEALTNDHRKVQALLTQLIAMDENTSAEERNQVVSEIRDELVPHSRAEEAVFYNSMRAVDSSKKLAMHGYSEHMAAEGMLRSLQVAAKIDLGWQTTAKELKAALDHHISEEEGEMFDAARSLFTQQEAEAMAMAFEKMKPEIKEEGLMGTTMDMIANLMPLRLAEAFKGSETTK